MEDKNCYIHPSSFVDPGVKIGGGTKVWHFCHLMTGCEIGCDCSLGQNVMVAPGVKIKNRVRIQNNVSLYSGVICEEDVFLGPSCVFTNVRNPRSFVNRKQEFKPTHIGKGATVGANATIVCGNPIGNFALIAAGAVVTHPVPAHAIVAGVPAKIIGWVCRCGETLSFTRQKARCLACNRSYHLQSDKIMEVIRCHLHRA